MKKALITIMVHVMITRVQYILILNQLIRIRQQNALKYQIALHGQQLVYLIK